MSVALNKAVDAWRMVLAYGVETPALSHNVAATMKKVERVRREMDTYTPDEIRRVLRVADDIHQLALRMGGTTTGEHGVGTARAPYMAQEHGPALEVMRREAAHVPSPSSSASTSRCASSPTASPRARSGSSTASIIC